MNSTIAIALCTSAALIAFAFDQRYQQHVSVSSAEFFVAAAAICLAPALYAQYRRKTRCKKMTNAV